MLKKKLLTAGLIIITASIIIAGLVYAQGKGPGFKQGFGEGIRERIKEHKFRLMQIIEEIGFTDEQLDKAKKLRFDMERKIIDLRHNIQIKSLELRETINSDNPDRNKIYSLIEDIGSLRTEIHKLRVGFKLDIWDMMTPEQKAEFKKLKKEFPNPVFEGRGPGMNMFDDMPEYDD